MRYRFGGLIHGGAYFRNFTVTLFLNIKQCCAFAGGIDIRSVKRTRKSETGSARLEVTRENICFSSLFAAGDVSREGTSGTQRQKFHTDDVKPVRIESGQKRSLVD